MLVLLKINAKSLFTLKSVIESEIECEADNIKRYGPDENGVFQFEYYADYYEQAVKNHESLCDVNEAIWRALENSKPAEM